MSRFHNNANMYTVPQESNVILFSHFQHWDKMFSTSSKYFISCNINISIFSSMILLHRSLCFLLLLRPLMFQEMMSWLRLRRSSCKGACEHLHFPRFEHKIPNSLSYLVGFLPLLLSTLGVFLPTFCGSKVIPRGSFIHAYLPSYIR